MMSASVPAPAMATPLPLAAAANLAFRTRGRFYLTVIAKATFAFAPNAPMFRVEPQEILRTEIHHGKNPMRSVRFTSDLVPHLGRADVLFTGDAFAPTPHPVEHLPVRLALFSGEQVVLDKRLLIRDERGFERIPIVYEHAFGGPEVPENPLGVGTASAPGQPTILDPSEPRRPAGLGPIARAWPVRRRMLGSLLRSAIEGPDAEIPDDFCWPYYQAAPADQQLDRLRGDEWLLLEGLHPVHPQFWTRLPGARGMAQIFGLSAFGVSEGQALELTADTLRIDGEEQRCTIVWRKSFAVPNEAALAAARIVAGVELPGEPITWPRSIGEQLASLGRATPSERGLAGAWHLVDPVRSPSAPRDSCGLPARAVQERTMSPLDADDELEAIYDEPTHEEEGHQTLALGLEEHRAAKSRGVLPFRASDFPPDPRSPTIDLSPVEEEAARVTPSLPFQQSVRAAPGEPRQRALIQTHERALPLTCPPTFPPTFPPAFPPMFTPSTDDEPPRPSFLHTSATLRPTSNPPPLVVPRPDEDVQSALAPGQSAPPEATVPIDVARFATISAELAERRAPRAEVLKSHGLSEARWMETEKRWALEMEQEATRGKRALRDAFDAAYVAAWEAIRGPLAVDTYARLTVAAERGKLASVLDALALRRTVWMRIQRTWDRRMASDRRLASLVQKAVAGQRQSLTRSP